jgi:hypothetical protein
MIKAPLGSTSSRCHLGSDINLLGNINEYFQGLGPHTLWTIPESIAFETGVKLPIGSKDGSMMGCELVTAHLWPLPK